ncbi:MAG: LamG-like jellyroll fold domain-containing protein, partial [Candidatus Kapaibacterium sp.]
MMKLRLFSILCAASLLALASCSNDKLTGPTNTPTVSDTIALWNFDGNTTDASGNGHTGTINGAAAYGADRFGNANHALMLDGQSSVSTSDKADVDFTGDNSFTISAWVKTTDSNAMGIVAKGPADGSEPGYQLDLNTIELGLWSSVTTASQNQGWGDAFPTDVSDGRWHMLTMVVTAHTGIALY